MRTSMALISGEMGRTVGRKFWGSRRKAWKVGSATEADLHGLRPVVRFRSTMANDQISLNIGEYVGLEGSEKRRAYSSS